MKLLIYLTGGEHWMGGIQYTRNLIRAISLLPCSELPDLVLKIGRRNKGIGYEEEFLHYPNVVIDRPKIPNTGVFRKMSSSIWRLKRKASRKSYSSCVKMISDECEVAFPAKGPNILGPSKKIYWVPDFQYKNLPELFSNEERDKRDALYNEMFSEEGILVVSSEAVKADFYTFFPKFASKKVRVLPFSSVFVKSEYDLDPIETCNYYGLPEKFIYMPNQMWQHKGHDYTIMALGKLKDNGITPPLVLTGNISDYRTGSYGDYIRGLIEKHNLETQVFHLGIIPRQEQVQIYRRAALILQPSLFEGWSTVVEDARALGKSILMSDINVHLEQNPFKGFYFKVGDVSDLANKIASIWPNLDPGPSLGEEEQLIISSNERAVNYAHKFMSIVREASGDTSHQFLNKDRELHLYALHSKIDDSYRQKQFGIYYTKKLRSEREKAHPPGKPDYRIIKTSFGFSIKVNLGDRMGCDMFYGIFNEKSEFLIFAALINPGDTVIDVGANIGMYTIASSIRVGHAGQVVSFEPDSRAYPLLEENVKINALLPNIILRRLCLADIEGKFRFYETDEPCLSGIFNNLRSNVNQVTEYPVNTLDNELQEAGVDNIDLIKIDVEGSESKVLKGAMGTLGKSDALILLEVSFKNGDAKSNLELIDVLKQMETNYGYQVSVISTQEKNLFTYENVDLFFTENASNFSGNVFLTRRGSSRDTSMKKIFENLKSKLKKNESILNSGWDLLPDKYHHISDQKRIDLLMQLINKNLRAS